MGAGWEWRAVGEELGKGGRFWEFWWVGEVLMKCVRWNKVSLNTLHT